jgi:hypothetical protein
MWMTHGFRFVNDEPPFGSLQLIVSVVENALRWAAFLRTLCFIWLENREQSEQVG